jgi:hypothetical protein
LDARFFHRLWLGPAPVVFGAAHFFVCYLVAASGCRGETWAVLLGVTLAALAVAGWLVRKGWQGGQPCGMLGAARLAGAILALVAIGWGALPLLVFGACW